MAHNYRNQSGRSGQSRGGGYQGGSDRGANRGNEYSPNFDRNDQPRNAEGERDHFAGQGYRGERGHDENRDFGRDFGPSANQGYGGRDERGSRMRDWGHFDENDRSSAQGGSGQDYGFGGGGADFYERDRGTSTSKWHEDQGDGGGYFNTGSYVDDGASRSLSNDFYRARAQQRGDSKRFRERDNPQSRGYYGRSYYGSQSNDGRGQADNSQNHPWQRGRGGSYDDRSSWSYGQGAGSGSSGGAYGRDPQLSGQNYGSFGGSGSTQSFRGRGPRGYQRSDDRLKEMICERLTDDPAIDASNITIEVSGQVVKLTGTVDDRSTKYEVEELIEQMGGVKDIDNQLKVQSSRWASQQQSEASSGQQARGGSDGEPGSSSTTASGSSTARSSAGTSSGASTTASPGASKRN